MPLGPLNPKCVIEESLLEEFENVLAKKMWDRTLSDQAFMTLRVQETLSVETFIKSSKFEMARIRQVNVCLVANFSHRVTRPFIVTLIAHSIDDLNLYRTNFSLISEMR